MTFLHLKTQISQRLSELTSLSLYGKKAPSKGEEEEESMLPYCIFKFPNSDPATLIRQDWFLELDFWCIGDSELIATEANLVKRGLNGYYYSSSSGMLRCFLDLELEDMPTEHPDLSRINQRYVIRTY